jgi:hypothetical protein
MQPETGRNVRNSVRTGADEEGYYEEIGLAG